MHNSQCTMHNYKCIIHNEGAAYAGGFEVAPLRPPSRLPAHTIKAKAHALLTPQNNLKKHKTPEIIENLGGESFYNDLSVSALCLVALEHFGSACLVSLALPCDKAYNGYYNKT